MLPVPPLRACVGWPAPRGEAARRELRVGSAGQRGAGRWQAASGMLPAGGGFLLINDEAFLAFTKGRVGKLVEPCQTRRGDFARAFHSLLLPRWAPRIFAASDIPVWLRGAQTREPPRGADQGASARAGDFASPR